MEARKATVEQPAFLYRIDGRSVVLVHGDRPPDNEGFLAFLSELEAIAKTRGSVRVLVYAAGDGGPNATQRAALRKLAPLPMRSALVTDSPAMRAVVTAVSWVMKQPLRAFPTKEAPTALDFLEVGTAEKLSICRMLAELCAEGHFSPLKF